jgi:DNA-binding transcriptional ArsR family regulator
MARRTKSAVAHGTEDVAGPAAVAPLPEAERLISDVETLKALSDPLRLRILEMMVTRHEAAWSVKELAAALGVPQTRLYHHIELLTERDLLRAAEQRVVSGIIETRYRLAALSLRLDPNLVRGGGAGQSAAREMMTTIFDETRRDVETILANPRTGDVDAEGRPHVSRGLVRLTSARASELKSRLEALLTEYDQPDRGADVSTYRILVAMYAAPAAKEPSHD